MQGSVALVQGIIGTLTMQSWCFRRWRVGTRHWIDKNKHHLPQHLTQQRYRMAWNHSRDQ
jgi:hypothetical protein